jgi:tRNA pseudouridine38-40 synthase
MPRYALVVSYDGASFNGWQSQSHGNGVQDHLELALSKVAGEQISTTCAGRTDTGVHASTQVVHFESAAKRRETAWTRGLNSNLPSAIAIQHVLSVEPSFHARFDAQMRRYHYLVYRSSMRQALVHQRATWIFRDLNIAHMRDASQSLLGEHDFTSFRSSECQSKTPVRHLHQLTITEHGRLLCFEFVANGFLHHMIRNLMGSLIYVGVGKYKPQHLDELLKARNRRIAAPTLASDGLYFTGVNYGVDHPVTRFSWPEHPLPFTLST